MQVVLPDVFLTNVIRASQVHCMLAARSEDHGRRVAPWISSDRYGPLESEANAVIHGMDLLGQSEFARRGLEFFIKRYDPKGFLTTGYTLVGTGEHLWTLAEHVERTQDRAWMKTDRPGCCESLPVDRPCSEPGPRVAMPAARKSPSLA